MRNIYKSTNPPMSEGTKAAYIVTALMMCGGVVLALADLAIRNRLDQPKLPLADTGIYKMADDTGVAGNKALDCALLAVGQKGFKGTLIDANGDVSHPNATFSQNGGSIHRSVGTWEGTVSKNGKDYWAVFDISKNLNSQYTGIRISSQIGKQSFDLRQGDAVRDGSPERPVDQKLAGRLEQCMASVKIS